MGLEVREILADFVHKKGGVMEIGESVSVADKKPECGGGG